MVRASRVLVALSVVCGLLASAACSSAGRRDSEFHRDGSSSGGDGTSSGGGDDGTSSSGGFGGSSSSSSSGGFAECASQEASASLSPVYLTILLDKSGSMCYYGSGTAQSCGNSNSRWRQVQNALNSFFQSPESAGVFVSVIPFTGALWNECDRDTYSSVPNGFPYRLELPVGANVSLGGDPSGGTPTAPALAGGLQFSNDQAASGELPANAKVAMLFATDGVPDGCYDNNGIEINGRDGVSADELQPSLDAAGAAVAANVPLYVLGIGGASEFTILDQIAAVAGTNNGTAFKIDASNPGDVGASMLAALSAIRGEQLSCDLDLPDPPAGETLDPNKVNVVFTPEGGEENTLSRSDDCADPNGWHYDNPSAPTRIELCDGACDTAKSGSLKIVLGCATQGPR